MFFAATLTYDDGRRIVIFADSPLRLEALEEAIGDATHVLPEGWRHHDWAASDRNPNLIGIGMSMNLEGVGVFTHELGWRVLPINYAAFGIEPPDEDAIPLI